MKKTLLLIIGILISFSISAQTAHDFLNTVVEKNKSYNDISIVFNYKVINKEAGINENMSGYASMKGKAYKLNIEGQEMISNGTTLWTHLIEDEEVMISEVTEDNDTSPLAIIESFSKNITVSFINNGTDTTILEVKENEVNNFEKITITVDSKNLTLREIHAYLSDGNEFVYEITSFTTNQNLPDSMFIFNEDQHPNVEIIDMR